VQWRCFANHGESGSGVRVADCVKFRKTGLRRQSLANYNQCEARGATMRRSCPLCLLVLASCITFSFAQQQPSPGSLTCSPQAKAITVWKVGSPYYNGAPGKAISPDLKMKAKSFRMHDSSRNLSGRQIRRFVLCCLRKTSGARCSRGRKQGGDLRHYDAVWGV
jgi:hypothetical protein